jgi:hypothetical protein
MYLRSRSAASFAAWNTECSHDRDHLMKIDQAIGKAVHI